MLFRSNESKGWIDDPLANVTVVFEYFPVVSILSSMDFWTFIVLIFASGFSVSFKSLAQKPFFFSIKNFMGNTGLPFYTSGFGSFSIDDDTLTNITVVFEYFPVVSILSCID